MIYDILYALAVWWAFLVACSFAAVGWLLYYEVLKTRIRAVCLRCNAIVDKVFYRIANLLFGETKC